ncbi:MAG TPA: Zn-dependent alcohol dehydrogenase [Ilumatobacteraceae bacterium]|nr:Zn-dependent alcohol dehydrogenase [Ilumatobacteraceae bacterium]
MRAAILHDGAADLVVDEIEHDTPGPHEVLIRIEACGLCHSDLHCIDGTLVRPRPQVLGHEAAGVVEAVGSAVQSISGGDRVVTCLLAGCGGCAPCHRGEPGQCRNPDATKRSAGDPPRLATLDGRAVNAMGGVGGLAERVLMDERGVIAIPGDVPVELAAILGCAVVTGLGAVFHVAHVAPGDTVAVIGCGGVGLNVIQGARIAGAARIVAIDANPLKLPLAGRLGATDLVDASAVDPVEAVRGLIGVGVDHAFEVVGRPATVALAMDMAAAGKTAYVVGVMSDDAQVTIAATNLRRGKSLRGVFMGGGQPKVDIPRYVELWSRGLLDLESMVSRTLTLDEVNDGFRALASGEVARAVVRL